MAHTLVSNVVHLIWATKVGGKTIREDLQPAMWSYISGIAKHNNFKAIAVNGLDDHCHSLIVLPSTISLSKAVQLLKGGSSKVPREARAALQLAAWICRIFGERVGPGEGCRMLSNTSATRRSITKSGTSRQNTSSFSRNTAWNTTLATCSIDIRPRCDAGMNAGSIYIRPRCGLGS
jgi:REP element-mobilizing transposase RayT